VNARDRSKAVGSGVVLAGAIGFAVACFLPYFEPGSGGGSLSLWGLFTVEPSAAETIATVLILFTGPAVLIGISLVALIRPQPWTAGALIPASIVWSLMWIGLIISGSTRSNTGTGVGYWVMLVCVVGVLIGATAVFVSARAARGSKASARRDPEPPGDA
jgi:hypothetical protein